MDPALYKIVLVKRGLSYSYYHSPARAQHPTLLLLHGFPSSSFDWHVQVNFLQEKGYGTLVPDMLGSGDTARPLDPEAFRLNSIAGDIVDILDNEKLEMVVGVAHDWGCVALSRLSMLYPHRFLAFAWLGLSFMEPITTKFELDSVMALMKEILGYEGYSYWKFLVREDAATIIERNVDSFLQLLYPKDPEVWLTHMALPGKTAEWIEGNSTPGFPEYLSENDIHHLREKILNGGIKSALNWYVAQVRNVDLQDNLNIPEERWTINRPSFFAVALKDCICTPLRGKASMEKYGTNVTTVEFETGHWPHLESPVKLNEELNSWLHGLELCATNVNTY